VSKLGQHYQITGPADKIDAAKHREILFYREAELEPGTYSVEAIALDTATNNASVRTTSLEAPTANDTKLRISSLAVLRRAERLTEADRKQDNPFHFGEVLIYPNLGEPLRKSVNKQIAFFFDVYPAKGTMASPKLTIQVMKDGKSLVQTSPGLPEADSQGRI